MTKVIGKLRPSQLLHYHAPGAIVDLIEDSVMVTAIDDWKIPYTNRLQEQRLESLLKISHLKLINDQEEKVKVMATPFPKWRICPSCGMMDAYAQKICFYCDKNDNKKVSLYPSRFVIVCERGHIDEFPWIDWVHQGKNCTQKPVLKYKSNGTSGSLSDIFITCVKCKKSRSLAQVMNKNELRKVLPAVCTGERPWLRDRESDCNAEMQTSFRGASNIYTPTVTSALSIPRQEGFEDELQEKVEHHRHSIENLLKLPDREIFKQSIIAILGIDQAQYNRAMKYFHHEEQTFSYDSIRQQEWGTFLKGNVNDRNETGFISKKVELPSELKPYLNSLVKVDKLREVRVLQGFTRLYYPDPFTDEKQELVPIMRNKLDWLPAITVHGEGIFFEFSQENINYWENNKFVQKESGKVIEKYNNLREQFGYVPRSILPRYINSYFFPYVNKRICCSFWLLYYLFKGKVIL
jgi:hypothetical protein